MGISKLYRFFTILFFVIGKSPGRTGTTKSMPARTPGWKVRCTGKLESLPYACQSWTCSWYSSAGISLAGTVKPVWTTACSICRRRLRARR